jgi:hypothetical protein
MKNWLLAAVLVAALAGSTGMGSVFAQNTAPPANPNASTPAVANSKGNNPGAPAAGANSFTEAQAKSRIEGAGYSNVSGLTKDQNGIWRGKAAKGGTTVGVAVDYQGNVVAE